jgi:putative ABC transport system permease protein
VACTLVVVSLLRTVNSTIPEDSPALVMYDILPDQLTEINTQIQVADAEARITIAPLVRARMKQVNNTPLEHLSHLSIGARREALEDEYKLSYLLNNIDEVTIVSGQWWEDDVISGLPKIALEDREAYEVGIKVGDKVIFNIQDQPLMVEVAAIYSQKGLQTRYWFEGILQQGSLDPFINRYVGTAHMSDQAALQAQNQIAAQAPNVIMVRTAELLNAARDLLGKASTGLAVVAVVSLTASLLVLSSVMAAGRARQIYHATVLHSLGTRVAVIRRSLYAEYLLLAVLTALFAIALGSAIALPLLQLRMKLPSHDLLWSGASVGIVTSILSLGLGTRYLLARLRISPAILLRDVE